MPIKSKSVLVWSLLVVASFVLSFLMYGLAMTAADSIETPWICCLATVALSAAMIALYALFVRWFEQAPARDIPLRRLAPDTLKGLGIGFAFFVVVVLIMLAAGFYRIDSAGTDSLAGIFAAFIGFLMVAVGEEIIFRGVLFRWIDEKWGFVAALIASSLLFGLMHIFQPGATLWSSFAIAIEAGLLLGAAYKYSGTLWLPIGIHWAWNFTEGNIFGFAVSGGDAGVSLIQPSISGPDILTGGVFGAEASIIALTIGLALSIWFILAIHRRQVSNRTK